MKHIQTIETRNLCQSAKNGGCGECQTSCQSACKTSSGIANQQCENKNKSAYFLKNAAFPGGFFHGKTLSWERVDRAQPGTGVGR